MERVPQPMNIDDKYLYGINVRLEVLIEQFGSLLEHIAKREGISVEQVVDTRSVAPAPKSRKRG